MTYTDKWQAVDDYIDNLFIGDDDELNALLEACAKADMPPIQVSAAQGKMLYLLARVRGAKRILEIGTLGGYSTLWLARALPNDGKIITLEADAKHAKIARENFARSTHSHKIELREGAALDILPQLEGDAPFDMVFIDADKKNNPAYYDWARKLTHTGSVIIIDNVIRAGAVIELERDYPAIVGIREANAKMADDKGIEATILQTVGSKGYDGFALGIVK